MTGAPTTVAAATGEAVFEVHRFEQTAPDRVEIAGRWSGVRGRRFMRPTLDVPGQRPLLALLDHKPWAPDAEQWIAAFTFDGSVSDLAGAELAVSPDVVVSLPAPAKGGVRFERRKEPAKKPAPPPEPRGDLRTDLDALITDRDRLHRQLEDARGEAAGLRREIAESRGEAERLRREIADLRAAAGEDAARRTEVDELRRRVSSLERERAALMEERDAAREAREAAVLARDAGRGAVEAALAQRDAAIAARDPVPAPAAPPAGVATAPDEALLRERDALVRERDAALRQRDTAIAQREAARATPVDPRSHDHENAVLWISRGLAITTLLVAVVLMAILLRAVF